MRIRIRRIKTAAFLNKFLTRYKTAAFLGGLSAFALPPFYFFPLAFVSFTLLALMYYRENSLKRLAEIGYWFGFGYFAVGLYWIGNAVLVDAATTGWLYPVVLLMGGAFFGLFVIPAAMATKYANSVIGKVVLFSAVWGLCAEWFRSFFLTGFPWNPVSSVLTFSPQLMQVLSIFGTYGVSVLLIVIFSSPALWLTDRYNRKSLAAVCCCGVLPLLLLWGYGEFVLRNGGSIEDSEVIRVRLVQPSIPQSLKWDRQTREDNFRQYAELSRTDFVPDFIVWGETASPYDLTEDKYHQEILRSVIPENGYLITGMLRFGESDDRYVPYNSLALINSAGQVLDTYDKTHLVPFGEYIPFRKYLPEWVRPLTNTVADFGQGRKYQTIKPENFPEFVPLICYEIIFSGQVVRKENKPKWMVLLTNDGWYGDSAGPYQHLAAAQMRAVEEGISIVRSANNGISAVIDSYGRIVQSLKLNEKGALNAEVKLDQAHDTLFGRYGNIVPVTLCLLLIAVVISAEHFFCRRA